LLRRVGAGCRASLQREVAEKTWARCTDILPRAQMLAGTFPAGGSGANCFAAVLSAAGEADADDRWMQTDEFGRWLEDEATPVQGTAHDMDPGTVLVWREHGELAHAAVTIGDEIGRASCRERVESGAVEGEVSQQKWRRRRA